MSCFRYGFHTLTKYSNCCLTNDLYNHSIVSWSLVTIVLLIPNHTWCKLKELRYIVSWIHFALCISCVYIGLKVEISVYLCLHVGPLCIRISCMHVCNVITAYIYACIFMYAPGLRLSDLSDLGYWLGQGLLIISFPLAATRQKHAFLGIYKPRVRSVYNEGARWSSGINAANGARGLRFTSRILPTVQRPWTSR